MWSSWILTLGLILAVTLQLGSGQSLRATFNMAGVRGQVDFVKAPNSDEVTANWSLSGSDSYRWQLNEYYMNYDTTDKCSTTNIGPRLGSAGGTVEYSTSQSVVSLAVTGLESIEGRTVLLTKSSDTSVKVCATIMSSAKYVTVQARFEDGIYGNVYFRKAADSDNTLIYSDVYFGESIKPLTQYTWKVYQGWKTNCKNRGGAVFNPNGISGAGCSHTSHNNCAIGQLSAKVGNLSVGSTKASAMKRYTDANLPISAANSIIGNTLVLLGNANSVMFCTQITPLPDRTLMASFSRDGVKGHISFKQASPFDYTSIEVSLRGLGGRAGGYHVHKFPVPQRVVNNQGVCSAANVSGHYNPFNIVKSAGPADGVGTNDQYELGDISGKFGQLTNKDNISMVYMDWNMPLFGVRNVVDRSIVIHASTTGGPRWICTNVQDTFPVNSAMVTFTYPFIGNAIFRQQQSSWKQDTSIFIALNTADGTTTSAQYDWQIHESSAGDDWDINSPARCVSTGQIFEPTMTSTKSQNEYDVQCTSDDQNRCMQGDLTKKHGQVTVRAADGTAAENSYTDMFIPLTGTKSIIGKSIVILNGTSRVACATIYAVRERVAAVKSWSQGVTGEVKFTQSIGVIADETKIRNSLGSLAGAAGGYHVHVYPIPDDAAYNCSAATVAGHYNPFSIDTTTDPATTVGTVDQYEVGDLSGKFGYLSGTYSNASYQDSNLNLFGLRSVIGRSVVIHKMADGARWSCGNLVEDTGLTGGSLYQAKAVFNSNLMGYVLMSQYMYPDSSMSDTSIEIDLKYSDGSSPTLDHKWHVHEKNVEGDDMANTGRCSSTAAHFNPFMVNVKLGYDECGLTNPLRCEVGDQSGKLGTYSIGSGRMFATDVFLPLNGIYSIVGKAVVFHAENRGADRLACSTIMPEGGTTAWRISIDTPTVMHMSDIAMSLAQEMSVSEWQIVTVDMRSDLVNCTDIDVYFIGPKSVSLKADLRKMLAQGKMTFGSYKVCSGCTAVTSSCLLLAAVMVIIKLIS